MVKQPAKQKQKNKEKEMKENFFVNSFASHNLHVSILNVCGFAT